MKLIIQIPCYNEQHTLPLVVRELPREIEGIDTIEYQIVDDGSTDATVKVAKKLGVHHIVQFRQNRGLGMAFKYGIANALENNADILVTLDADGEHPPSKLSSIIRPIILGQADIVIGNRRPTKVPHYSFIKRLLQGLGNIVVGLIVGEKVPDAVCGYRAYSREVLTEINITTRFSYVLDSLIQASKKGFKIAWVRFEVRPPTRPSRLFGNIFIHIRRSTVDLLRVYIMYEPLQFFFFFSIPSIFIGSVGLMRYAYFFLFTDQAREMVSVLIIATIFITIGATLFSLGIIGDLLAKNRTLLEENLILGRKKNSGKQK